ncbi:unnamed protein product [Rangifer tarandus platyrhynchus]|uniref:Uncharacterized protein n=1 Tax=Rangifer tarandus platyrhynchus TaxID=3082113 RepID=A0ABN8XYM5_RANTA|nr:unnamed protein product [Rangifer tarandus platyrhynchus]
MPATLRVEPKATLQTGPSTHSMGLGWGTAVPPWVPTAWPCQCQRPWPGGHSPCHPECPRPRGPRCPLCPAHLLPRPEATVLLAGASPSHTPSSLRIPRLKAQAGPTFQGNALSSPNPSPAPTPTDGVVHRSPAGVPAPRSKQEEQDKVGGPSSDLGWGTQGGGCLGSGVMAGAPVRPGFGGSRSPRQCPGVDGTPRFQRSVGSRCGGVASRAAPPPLGSALNGGRGRGRRGSAHPETSDAPRSPAQGRRPLGAWAGERRELVTRRAAPTPAPPSGSESGAQRTGSRQPATFRPPDLLPRCSDARAVEPAAAH